ncbi:Erp protein [Myxococcus sp. MxC21-1]|uniref:Erp protein n=1 Tax=Myxococcus sp. MxC21-1 TaxID=3041439 RepID=UPI0029315F59|nr:Erp protein [Myxococcus sp. MxC21-1]WNZ62741.1 Erp protein [Myxococcus sp. MxC21-1]
MAKQMKRGWMWAGALAGTLALGTACSATEAPVQVAQVDPSTGQTVTPGTAPGNTTPGTGPGTTPQTGSTNTNPNTLPPATNPNTLPPGTSTTTPGTGGSGATGTTPYNTGAEGATSTVPGTTPYNTDAGTGGSGVLPTPASAPRPDSTLRRAPGRPTPSPRPPAS